MGSSQSNQDERKHRFKQHAYPDPDRVLPDPCIACVGNRLAAPPREQCEANAPEQKQDAVRDEVRARVETDHAVRDNRH
jgi:hypothetical protein